MGRRAHGWRLWRDPKTGIYQARWTAEGRNYSVTTATRDAGEAAREAAKVYARWAAGQWKPTRKLGGRPPPLDELVVLWLDDFEAGRPRGGARDLLELHANTHFVPFFKNDVLELTAAGRIEAYQLERLRVVLRQTVVKEVSSLRSLLRWLLGQGVIGEMPPVPALPLGATGTRDQRQGKRHEIDLGPREVEALLAALPETTTGRKGDKAPIRVRDYFTFLYETGLRPSTVQALSVPEHWRPGRATLEVTPEIDKARFGRRLPLTERALEVLARAAPRSGLVFGEHDLRAPFAKAAKEAGAKGASPYDLRHARATHWVEDGGGLPGVAFLLGHKRVTTTNRYTKPSERAGRDVLKASKRKKGDGEGGGES